MRSFKEYSEKDITVVDYTPGMGKEISYNAQKRKRKDIEEISSNKLGDYMRKSAADAGKPGATARQQDKRIGGQSMADKKIRKKMGYSSTAKVPAGKNEEVEEGKARDRLVKMVDKASGRTMSDRQKDAAAATARRKEAEKDHMEFQRKMRMKEGTKDVEEGDGLWHNIHKKRKEGRPMRKPGSKGAPTKQDFKNASEDNASARMYKDNPDMMKQQGPGGFKSLAPKAKKTIKKTMKTLPPKPTKEATIPDGQTAMTSPAPGQTKLSKKDTKTMGKIADLMKRANESAPKVDPDKFAAHMAKSKKPKKLTSTQNSLADIRKRANEEEDGVAQSYLDQDSEKKRKVKKDKDVAVVNPKIDNKRDAVAEEQDQTDEALSMQQRRKKSRQMKRLKGRIKLGRERQKRKMADPERLKKRARKAARNEILKKLTKGVAKSELTYARRQELEKRLDKPAIKGRIDRLSKKMLPATRRKELDRRRGGASNKK